MPTLRLLPELEDSLRLVADVQAASVVTSPDRTPTEIHVLAAPGRSVLEVVRDVQSVALARHELEVDDRIVSVVQLREAAAEPGPALTPAGPAADGAATAAADESMAVRPRIASIMVRTSGQKAEASVTLATSDRLLEGKAVRQVGAAHRPRLVAAATLDALGDMLGHACEVESAAVLDAGGRTIALCVLTLALPRLGEQVLTGSAIVRGDDAEAVCRAVLAAVNRQLSS